MGIEVQEALSQFLKQERLGTGPWVHEHDYVEWKSYGYRCEVQRTDLGHLCGYVTFDPQDVTYAVQDFNDVSVHGGVTYFFNTGDGKVKVGFDCAHSCDLSPRIEQMLAKAHRSSDQPKVEFPIVSDSLARKYRDITFVMRETEYLADQIAKMQGKT